jgi:hypothetical protein
VVSRYRIDWALYRSIGIIEFVAVFVDVADGVYDVAANEHKSCVAPIGDIAQRRDQRVLTVVALPSIAHQQEGKFRPVAEVDAKFVHTSLTDPAVP